MKLQQLRYLVEVSKQGLSISEAAEKLHTSQPGISKQIRLLEDELGIQIFIRNGKRIVDITAPGREVLIIAKHMLLQAQNLKKVAHDFVNADGGSLTIAATHTQARYELPLAIQNFSQRYPKVQVRLKQGSPAQICEMVLNGDADIAIATEEISFYPELAILPCYTWNHSLIVPNGHALSKLQHQVTLQDIASYPIITYDFAFTGCTKIKHSFEMAHLNPNITLTAMDSDIIKTYVDFNLGIGIVASMAYDSVQDATLTAIDISHLFESSTTRIGIRKDAYLRGYAYNFIELFAPMLDKKTLQAVLLRENSEAE